MERSLRQVMLLLMKFGSIGNNRAALILALGLFAVPLRAQGPHAAGDFLIVEHGERLVLYNRYQQQITPEERKWITPFVPIKILDAASKLNDDFTPCMSVEIHGHAFYILQNDAREFPDKRKLGFMHIYKNASVLKDTVRLISSGVTFYSPDQHESRPLLKGNILERYFREGKNTFVGVLGKQSEYGWVNFAEMKNAKAYRVLSSTKNPTPYLPLSDVVQKRIRSKLKEANKTLEELFAYFNAETSARKTVPQWQFVVSEEQYACVLEPEGYAEHYKESTKYLAGEIDDLLLGTNLKTVAIPGKIDIRFK
jgi:hypothetical protein